MTFAQLMKRRMRINGHPIALTSRHVDLLHESGIYVHHNKTKT